MAEQEAMTDGREQHDPLVHGLWTRFVDNGRIVHGAWLRACAERSHVGTCRECGNYLAPVHPYEVRPGCFDYEYHCTDTACGHTHNAPGGRMFMRSSRKSERNGGTHGA